MNINTKEKLVHIHQCRGMSWKSLFNMLQFDSTLTAIYRLSKERLSPFFHHNKQIVDLFYNDLHTVEIQEKLNVWQKDEIFPICIMDTDYPVMLKQIPNPPWVLYVKGDPSLFQSEKIISVVGSRTPTNYGKVCLNQLIFPLVKDQWTIVSGLAKGIDAFAHFLAVKNGGKTIAVLGSGFYHLYPQENKQLAIEIARDHLLISEYPPEAPPKKWHFPERNRIISGISKGTIVIEAKQRSGSLITAYHALEQGKEVFAVPGSVSSLYSVGTNKLIQDGAKLVIKHTDITDELMINNN